ncbi:MAG: hypothetical protein CVU73_02130 [Deltaproteobacteria bacterium HGW-Deltaproteobacteria-8]|jgi:hypothetical protein|nr:MAG: hypothetical protein CVU73_02130 [Deltaproteobacteria bacterium HGW-Deltaproteobacteria-8]
MDYFEGVVATLLEFEGYWVNRSFKVELTIEDKRSIGLPCMPRVELDLLAYCAAKNEIIVFEVKSYLDSPGVKLKDISEKHDVPKGRYKLFTSERYREVVFGRLRQELMLRGMANSKTIFTLGLAAGKVYQGKSKDVEMVMRNSGWRYISPEEIKLCVMAFADEGYENDPTVIAAKILTRDTQKQ